MAWVRFVVVVVAIWMAGGPAFAWEFSMRGELKWNIYNLWCGGSYQLFGPHDADAGAGPRGYALNNRNLWGGVNDFYNRFYSSYAAVQTTYMDLYPQIRINRALRISSKLRIGSEDAEAAGEYRNNSHFPGTDRAFGEVYVSQLWVTADVPWGVVLFGKRPATFGIGTWFSSANTTTESLALIVPYGPFRFICSYFPVRPAHWWAGDHLFFGYDDLPLVDASRSNWARINRVPEGDDASVHRSPEFGVGLTYQSGSFEMGAYYHHVRWHAGPEAYSDIQFVMVPRDFEASWGVLYTKYNNGRFFFNAELDAFYGTVRNGHSQLYVSPYNDSPFVDFQAPDSGSVFQSTYTEMLRAAIETGLIFGPTKITAMWAWIPGFDRRHGIYIDRQPNSVWLAENAQNTPFVEHKRPPGMITLDANYANAGFFKPYSYLLAFQYGSGVGTGTGLVGGDDPKTDLNRDGQMLDANVYAARIDYAVAANLNLWVSFLWAERLSHGYGWGHIGITGFPEHPEYDNRGSFNAPSPAIPDNFLGYEWNIGFAWKLLEGLTLEWRLAYWQPGDWWKFAVVSKSNPNWADPDDDPVLFGTWPDRAIDPIYGMEIVTTVAF